MMPDDRELRPADLKRAESLLDELKFSLMTHRAPVHLLAAYTAVLLKDIRSLLEERTK
jgi:hypothetical protein